MTSSACTLGIDYGTNSVRALVVNCVNGRELGTCVVNYPGGHQGVLLDAANHHLARQHPGDYVSGLEQAVRGVLKQAAVNGGFNAQQIIGIGVDCTGSSPLPVDANNKPLGCAPEWENNLNAQCWLWKDHTSHQEAALITNTAAQHYPHYLAKCGNTYSSEWFWAKIWHCLNVDPATFDAAYSWVELTDFIPSLLAGVSDPKKIVRSICPAGHKALYCDEWNGLPDKKFLAMLHHKLAELRDRLYDKAHDATVSAGKLCPEWAEKLGLPVGIPIAIGEMDVHYGSIGSGIEEGVLVKAIGTSTCDCAVVGADKKIADVPGICGIVKGSILPGYYGIEAGQSAVGDIFKWFVEVVCKGNENTHEALTTEATSLRPGQSGLLALDWNNGNRTILVDQLLSGLLLGQTLYSTPAEIYRALIEATAFGARAIIERLTEYGVPIKRVVCCGGIAEKNELLSQIYADVIGCDIHLSGSGQACALGAAVSAAVIAGKAAGGYDNFTEAQKHMTSLKARLYRCNAANHEVYNRLYHLYRQIHDAFGGVDKNCDLSQIMKDLIHIKTQATA
ncbi:MAG: ribulokinase [Verrucomicrobiales bacterium]|jgi:L-ribulokinase|nr:ribulokinase [Verrucomicrobiales bacterium]